MRLLAIKGQASLNLCFNCVFLVGICSLLSTEWSSLWCVKAPCLKLWLWTEKSTIPCTGRCSWKCNNLYLCMCLYSYILLFPQVSVWEPEPSTCVLQMEALLHPAGLSFKWQKSVLASPSLVGTSAVCDSPLRVRHRPSGEPMTSGCLRTAPCGAHLLSIHISTVPTMTATKRTTTTRAVRKAV